MSEGTTPYRGHEYELYRSALDSYLASYSMNLGTDREFADFVESFIDVESDRAVVSGINKLRLKIAQTLQSLHERCPCEELLDKSCFDFKLECNAREYPYLFIARRVLTKLAVEYFSSLSEYCNSEDTEDVRNRVRKSAVLLLSQLESIFDLTAYEGDAEEEIEKTRVAYRVADLSLLVDFEAVTRDSGFSNVFTLSDMYKFEGRDDENKSVGNLSNSYAGIRPADILFFLNTFSDIALHDCEEGFDPMPFGLILCDGLIDFDENSEFTTGLDMTVETVGEKEVRELVEKIVFSAQQSTVDDVQLTADFLEEKELLPKYAVRFDGATIYLTDKLYKSDDGSRTKTLIYVDDGERGIVARSVYKSGSHAVWKLLPAFTDTWYNKAQGEEQITLPIPMQRALSFLCDTQRMQDCDLVFYGAAKKGFSLAGSFMATTDREPIPLGVDFDCGFANKIVPDEPTSFQFDDEGNKPDYSNVTDSWTEDNETYGGQVVFEVIQSLNGQLHYLFCRDNKNRVWIAAIEIKGSEITSYGIRSKWILGGDLITPLYTHRSEGGKYRDFDDVAGYDGQYVGMWSLYLSKIPMIREYMATRGISVISS